MKKLHAYEDAVVATNSNQDAALKMNLYPKYLFLMVENRQKLLDPDCY